MINEEYRERVRELLTQAEGLDAADPLAPLIAGLSHEIRRLRSLHNRVFELTQIADAIGAAEAIGKIRYHLTGEDSHEG